jgi:uncharacterized protein (TIGR02147 family)
VRIKPKLYEKIVYSYGVATRRSPRKSVAAAEPRAASPDLEPIDVFGYLDYRAYLRDYYVRGKQRGRLSFRAFSRRAGLGSPNYLKLVIDGQRSISDAMAARFAAAAGLKQEAATYFCELVRFNQTKGVADRSKLLEKLTGHQRYREIRPLDAAHAAYHSNWYLPAVRELAARRDFREDPAWIARTLWPSISIEQAQSALDTLLELGLLERDAQGDLKQGEPLLSTGAEVMSLNVARFHQTMLERASASIESVPAEERDISSLTLCLGADGIRRLKERLRAFRRELLELSAVERDPKQVVQLSLALFPLSRLPKGKTR